MAGRVPVPALSRPGALPVIPPVLKGTPYCP